MSSTDLQEEIERLKTNVGVLAQALNTTLILFQGVLAAKDWDSFCELRDQVAREHDFQICGHRLIITGLCEHCRRTKRKRPRRKQDRL